jgi:hypothetical protein
VSIRKRLLGSDFFISLCPAPSIGEGAGKKRADLFESAAGGRVSASSGRIDDAQDQAGHRRFLLVRFLSRERK